MPLGPEELDDFEFQLFILLRKWRLDKARALDIETYKIFPNRVLAEVIRRRRNDEKWAAEGATREDLVDCWGIAAGKMASGVAMELIEEVEKQVAKKHLADSRLLIGMPPAASEDDGKGKEEE